jgi:hypothetical protein
MGPVALVAAGDQAKGPRQRGLGEGGSRGAVILGSSPPASANTLPHPPSPFSTHPAAGVNQCNPRNLRFPALRPFPSPPKAAIRACPERSRRVHLWMIRLPPFPHQASAYYITYRLLSHRPHPLPRRRPVCVHLRPSVDDSSFPLFPPRPNCTYADRGCSCA